MTEALVSRVMGTTTRLDFVFLNSFRDFCRNSDDEDLATLPDSAFEMLGTYQLRVKLALVQPALCAGTTVGLRLVISEFGLLNMVAAYRSRAVATHRRRRRDGDDTGSSENHPREQQHAHARSKVLKAYIEHGLACMLDLPCEAVVVAQWIPGHVAVLCCMEADSTKWDVDSKARLSRTFEQRLRHSQHACGVFQKIAERKRARRLPVTYAVGVVQRAWRRWVTGRPKREAETAAEERREGGGGGGGGNGGNDIIHDQGVLARMRVAHGRFPRVTTPYVVIRQMADDVFDGRVQVALRPWWQRVEMAGGNGLYGTTLNDLG